jgi:AcrR family transcriptional regulator
MPRPRFERAAQASRTALLDAAMKEFAEHGYAAASISRVLLAAGLSKGAFYYYFDDKADLAATVLARESAEWIDALDALAPPATAAEFWEEMERLNERAAHDLLRSPLRSELMARLGAAAARDPELLGRLGPYFAEVRERLSAFYRCGQQVGAVRDDLPVEALMILLQGTKQAVTQALLPTERAATPDELARFLRINLDCLRRLAEPRVAPTPPPPPEEPP